MLSEKKILYLPGKDGNYNSKAYVKWGELEKQVQCFAVKHSATREKRKLNSLFLLIYVEKIMRERKCECSNFIYPFQYVGLEEALKRKTKQTNKKNPNV